MRYAGLWTENTAAQKRLLAEAKLELNKALEKALSMEMAEKQVLAMKTDVQNDDPEVKLLKVDRGQRRASPTTGPKRKDGGQQCWRCNGAHSPQVCRFKIEICHNCGTRRHIRSVYRNINKQKVRGGRVNRIGSEMLEKQDIDHVNDAIQYMSKLYVGALKEEPEAEDEFGLYKIKMDNPEASIMVPMTVNGNDMSFELDTGASKTVISEQTWPKQLE